MGKIEMKMSVSSANDWAPAAGVSLQPHDRHTVLVFLDCLLTPQA